MNLDNNEQDIYNQLNGDERKEIDALSASTELWNRLPKMAALVIATIVVASFIF